MPRFFKAPRSALTGSFGIGITRTTPSRASHWSRVPYSMPSASRIDFGMTVWPRSDTRDSSVEACGSLPEALALYFDFRFTIVLEYELD